MAVNLARYVAQLQGMCSPPGTDLFPEAVTADWVMRLRNGFWDARLDGFLVAYTENADTESPGIVIPVAPGAPDLDGMGVQIVLFYAQLNATSNRFQSLQTTTRATAGSVSFETQQGINILRDVLKELTDRRKQLIEWFSKQGWIPIGYHDAGVERELGLLLHDVPWIR